jgi:hypothetical protein
MIWRGSQGEHMANTKLLNWHGIVNYLKITIILLSHHVVAKLAKM